MVEWWDYREVEPTRKRKVKEAQICTDSPGQVWVAEVNSESKRENVKWVPEERTRSWGVESSKVDKHMGRSDHGDSDLQSCGTGKCHHRERSNAGTRVRSPEWAHSVLRTTPGGDSPPVHHKPSRWTSPICAISWEYPSPASDVFWSLTPTLGVGERENHGSRKRRYQSRPTPSCVESGKQGRNLQTWIGWLYKTPGLLLKFCTILNGGSG